ncbi:MAG: HK97 gp10 family phage protein [Methanobrevibacter sp.]|uniref:HK97 gp10 family phage protein n=1 Tax=Methanobrevibacter sp. TaxID=66852 RepID=UPI0025D783A3|nr:HK97 gp10 family phage protein [Methanobrevibacter sp.]MBE6508255.1 HK97 gp10 family phage protein [Methanobrevibacter sp.]
MVKVIIKVDASRMQKIGPKMPEIRRKGLNYAGQGMVRNLMINSPVDHGLLRQWFFSNVSDNEIEIRTPASYAPYVNDGTGIYGPHKTPIYSKTIGKPIAFQVGGKMVYTRMIRGQKGQHFVEKSINQTRDKLGNYFIKAVREVLE